MAGRPKTRARRLAEAQAQAQDELETQAPRALAPTLPRPARSAPAIPDLDPDGTPVPEWNVGKVDPPQMVTDKGEVVPLTPEMIAKAKSDNQRRMADAQREAREMDAARAKATADTRARKDEYLAQRRAVPDSRPMPVQSQQAVIAAPYPQQEEGEATEEERALQDPTETLDQEVADMPQPRADLAAESKEAPLPPWAELPERIAWLERQVGRILNTLEHHTTQLGEVGVQDYQCMDCHKIVQLPPPEFWRSDFKCIFCGGVQLLPLS